MRPTTIAMAAGLAVVLSGQPVALQRSQGPQAPPASPRQADPADQALVQRYCTACHNARTRSGDLVLDGLDVERPGDRPEVWEKVVRKLRGGLMPPAGMPRPAAPAYAAFLARLEDALDAAAERPDPGRTEIVHRLNRLEYQHAVRDVLAVEIDAADLPVVLAGGGGGQLKGGRHLRYPLNTPFMNLAVTLLDKVGAPVDSLADSSGRLTDL